MYNFVFDKITTLCILRYVVITTLLLFMLKHFIFRSLDIWGLCLEFSQSHSSWHWLTKLHYLFNSPTLSQSNIPLLPSRLLSDFNIRLPVNIFIGFPTKRSCKEKQCCNAAWDMLIKDSSIWWIRWFDKILQINIQLT